MRSYESEPDAKTIVFSRIKPNQRLIFKAGLLTHRFHFSSLACKLGIFLVTSPWWLEGLTNEKVSNAHSHDDHRWSSQATAKWAESAAYQMCLEIATIKINFRRTSHNRITINEFYFRFLIYRIQWICESNNRSSLGESASICTGIARREYLTKNEKQLPQLRNNVERKTNCGDWRPATVSTILASVFWKRNWISRW